MSARSFARGGFLVVALATLVSAPPSAAGAAPLTVCALSFHSPDEVDAFATHLPAPEFQLVSLGPAAPQTTVVTPIAFQTSRLCRADLRCDVVVLSGEFAGRFFGRSGASLGLEELEEASCQARCAGFFHAPREVFLLACNTLATKDQDNRTPDEYLQVLLDHGFDRPSAERVVQWRYGPLGPSFREVLRRIFMGVPRIYGFASVAPTGDHTAPLLDAYFTAVGDYDRYLDDAGRAPDVNRPLLKAFRSTDLVQVAGLTANEPAAADRTDVCALYDEDRPVAARLAIVRRLMAREDRFAFLPAIQTFVDRHPPATLTPEEARLFQDIQRNPVARQRVLELVQALDVSALQLELAHFALHMGWMTSASLRDLALAGARRLLSRPPTLEVMDVMCELPKHVSIGDEFSSEALPDQLFQRAEGVRVIHCLAPPDPRVSDRLLGGLDDPDAELRVWSVYTLSNRRPLTDVVLRSLAGHLDDPLADVRERLRWILRMEAPLADDVWQAVRARDPALADSLARTRKRHGWFR